MSNSNGPMSAPLHAARSPFGDELVGGQAADRLPGILAGNEKLIQEAAVNMVLRGGGFMLSGTRDAGAVGVHVFWGKTVQKRYAASPEALGALLEAVSRWEPAQPTPLRSRPAGDVQARR
jgi:hypothetical protein